MEPGISVRTHSLARIELNGCAATAIAFDAAKDRWVIEFEDKKRMLMREVNLMPISAPHGEPGMAALERGHPDEARTRRAHAAATRLRESWVEAQRRPPPVPQTRAEFEAQLMADQRVVQIKGVLDAAECAAIMRAVEAAGERRGWTKLRHNRYPTTDLPLSAVSECEAFVRSIVFRRVLRPLAPLFFPASLLPEHLCLRDAFFVRYSALPGEQRSLEMHSDGSIFSFNLLLSDPDGDFEGGGTLFEASGRTVSPPRGAAIGHSGQARHAGVAITRGQRVILVGFVGCEERDYGGVANAEFAAHDAFTKFGAGAWERSPMEPPTLLDDDAMPPQLGGETNVVSF